MQFTIGQNFNSARGDDYADLRERQDKRQAEFYAKVHGGGDETEKYDKPKKSTQKASKSPPVGEIELSEVIAAARQRAQHQAESPRVYKFRGRDEVYVRRESSYFNTSRSFEPSVLPHPLSIHDDTKMSEDIRTLKEKAMSKKSHENRAACLAAASKAGVTPLMVVLVWIVTGLLCFLFCIVLGQV